MAYNWKQQVIAKELESILAVRTGMATSYTEVSEQPVVLLGTPSVLASGGGSIRIFDQRGNVDPGFKSLPGFMTNQQPVFTTGVAQILVESTGIPSPVGPTHASQTMVVAPVTGGKHAVAWVDFGGIAALDEITVNGVVFTCKAAGPLVGDDFLRSTGDAAAAANFITAVNSSTTAGMENITAVIDGVDDTKIWLVVDASVLAAAANAYTLAESTATVRIIVSGATFGIGAGCELHVDGDAFLINGAQFTVIDPAAVGLAVLGALTGRNEFELGGTDEISTANLLVAFNASTDPLVANVITAGMDPAGGTHTVQFVADNAGSAYNGLYALVDGGTGNYVPGGATLTGAVDGAASYVNPVKLMTFIAECGIRGVKVELYMTPKGTAPTFANFASAVFLGGFDVNLYWPLQGRV